MPGRALRDKQAAQSLERELWEQISERNFGVGALEFSTFLQPLTVLLQEFFPCFLAFLSGLWLELRAAITTNITEDVVKQILKAPRGHAHFVDACDKNLSSLVDRTECQRGRAGCRELAFVLLRAHQLQCSGAHFLVFAALCSPASRQLHLRILIG